MDKWKRTKFLLFIMFIQCPLFGDAPVEFIFLKHNAPPIWQKAIGIFVQQSGDSILVVYEKPYKNSKVIFSGISEDTAICPLSAFGYSHEPLKKMTRKYPLLDMKNKYAKIVYNVNSGHVGWVEVKEQKREIMLFSDSLKFRMMDAIYLGTIGKNKSDTVFYFDRPGGKLIKAEEIFPFIPEIRKCRFGAQKKGHVREVWRYYKPDLFLGVVLKMKGNWVLMGKCKDYECIKKKKKGWIRIKDKNGNLLLWFIWVDRC